MKGQYGTMMIISWGEMRHWRVGALRFSLLIGIFPRLIWGYVFWPSSFIKGIRNFAFLRWFQKWKDVLTVYQLEFMGISRVQNLRLTRTRSKDLWKNCSPLKSSNVADAAWLKPLTYFSVWQVVNDSKRVASFCQVPIQKGMIRISHWNFLPSKP